MEYKFGFNPCKAIFPLPCEVVDSFLKEAPEEELKALLYIYRHGGLDTGTACEDLGLTPGRLSQAVDFWARKGLFACSEEPVKEMAAAAADKPRQKTPPEKKILETQVQYSSEEVAEKARENSEIKFLLDATPDVLGRLLSPSECSTLVYLYDGAGLPADVILMLLEYCVDSGHGNMRYIERMGLSWEEEGIDTHERAENKIKDLEARHSFEGKVKTALGIGNRALSQGERQHLNRWIDWSTPLELVKLSYDICVGRTGKLSFSYMNSILKAWHEKGITTPEQARNESKQPKQGKAPSYNIDEYVNLSMKRLLDN